MTTHATATVRADDDSQPSNREILARLPRPHIVVAGPEKFTIQEMQTIRFALEDRKARVTTLRMTDEFRMPEFKDAVEGCAWVLIAIDEFPGRELELLRVVEHTSLPLPCVGLICLADRVNVSNRLHVGGRIDLVVKRSPGDRSFSSHTRARDMILALDLTDESCASAIARAVVPHVPD